MDPPQVLASFQATMGPDLGALFFELHEDLVELFVRRKVFEQLFATSPQLGEILNRSAPSFFSVVQDQQQLDLLMRISRLLDKKETGGQRNCTLKALPGLLSDPSLRATVQGLVTKATSAGHAARDWRHKVLAHRVRPPYPALPPISLQDVDTALNAIAAVLSEIHRHYVQADFSYKASDMLPHSVPALVKTLAAGLAVQSKASAASTVPTGELR